LVVMSPPLLPFLRITKPYSSDKLYTKLLSSSPTMSADHIARPAAVKKATPNIAICDQADLASTDSCSGTLRGSRFSSASGASCEEIGRSPTPNYNSTVSPRLINPINGCIFAVRVARTRLSSSLAALLKQPLKWYENYQAAKKLLEEHNQNLYAAIKSEPGESVAKTTLAI
jgi:hypothetical protein